MPRSVMTPPADRSPYFTPPKTGPLTRSRTTKTSLVSDPGEPSSLTIGRPRLLTPTSPTRAVSKRRTRGSDVKIKRSGRSKRKKTAKVDVGIKERSLPSKLSVPKGSKEAKNKNNVETKKEDREKKKKERKTRGHDILTTDDTMNAVLTTSETGVVEPIGKIHLIQGNLDFPWSRVLADAQRGCDTTRGRCLLLLRFSTRRPEEPLDQSSYSC